MLNATSYSKDISVSQKVTRTLEAIYFFVLNIYCIYRVHKLLWDHDVFLLSLADADGATRATVGEAPTLSKTSHSGSSVTHI